MDLWIRSQRGRLCQIIDISEPILDEWDGIEGYCLYGRNLADSFIPLSMYKTKERVLEVLDEIQNKISDLTVLMNIIGLDYKRIIDYDERKKYARELFDKIVFEMPKE